MFANSNFLKVAPAHVKLWARAGGRLMCRVGTNLSGL